MQIERADVNRARTTVHKLIQKWISLARVNSSRMLNMVPVTSKGHRPVDLLINTKSDTSSSSSESSDLSGFGDLSTSDEEYLKVIGGDDDDGDDKPEVSIRQSSSLAPEERVALIDRIDRLEQTVARTNASLDRILQKLELREAGRGMIAGGGR